MMTRCLGGNQKWRQTAAVHLIRPSWASPCLHTHTSVSISFPITQQTRNSSSHPQSRHSGQIRVRGAGCNSMCSDDTWAGETRAFGD